MDAKTREIIDRFEQINAIPRCSNNEAAICDWLRRWAGGNGFAVRSDAAGNMVVSVPAAGGMAAAPTVVLQGHVDMVCEKCPDSNHDFGTDPVRHVVDGDWLGADGTSLGADNGIAVALAMVMAESSDVPHPPLELLFTVEEETGLNGVKAMAGDMLTGKVLLNLDSEEEGVFTVGCAGGRELRLTLPVERSPADSGWQAMTVTASGMQGGHSGIDIVKQRANANKILARCIDRIARHLAVRIVDLSGGTVKNAIPREATARILYPNGKRGEIEKMVKGFETEVRSEFGAVEPNLAFQLAPAETAPALSEAGSDRVVALMTALPFGMAAMSTEFDHVVETSNNVAVVRLGEDALTVLSSQRSSVDSRLDEICGRVAAVARLAGADVDWGKGYPPWTPDMTAPLLRRCREVYAELFDREASIQILHAGLECAVIGDLYPGMEMISFGPTIENPHSPDERLHLPAVASTWRFLVALVASFR